MDAEHVDVYDTLDGGTGIWFYWVFLFVVFQAFTPIIVMHLRSITGAQAPLETIIRIVKIIL
jgi:hypothetical protein